jgi:hypothetical protein
VDGIALEQQRIGLGVGKVVDRNQLEAAARILQDRAGHQAADAPKPLIATLVAILLISLLFEGREDPRHDRFGGEAEALEKVFRRRGGAEPVEADREAAGADIALPAEVVPASIETLREPSGRRVGAVGLVLRVEQAPAGHGDDIGADPLPFERFGGASATSTSDPVAISTTRGRRGGTQAVGAAAVGGAAILAKLREVLAGEAEQDGTVAPLQRQRPAFRRLDRIRGR